MAKIQGTRITVSVDVPWHPQAHPVTKIGDELRDFAAACGRNAQILSEELIELDEVEEWD